MKINPKLTNRILKNSLAALISTVSLLSRARKITTLMCAAGALFGMAESVYAQDTTHAGIFDAGASVPSAGANDISQFTGTANDGDYIDNQLPGETFTTGPNSLGYVLTGLYLRESSNTAGGGQPQLTTYNLRIYSLTNSGLGTATLLTQYITTNQVTFTQGDWLQIAGLTNVLAPNTVYAYSINRNGGGGWWSPAAVSPKVYAGGTAANFPTGIGTITVRNYNMAFDANLIAVTDPLVGSTVVSPSSVFAGPTVNLSATFSGTAPFTSFVWQTDGGTAGATWSNLSGSTTNTYSLSTAGLTAGTNEYRLIVTGGAGTVTNTPGSLVVYNPSAPFVVANTVISPSTTFAGNIVTMSATFSGSSPITYQWQYSDQATFTNNIAGATNSTYSISDAAAANSGSYRLAASNSLGSTPSSFATLTVTNSAFAVQILNIGSTTPTPAGFDIAQLSSVGNQKCPSGGLNYYSDNAATAACGQTFTTGSNPDGYLLSSLYIQWGNIEGSHPAANPYTLCIYSVSGTNVTLLQTYTNQNSAAAMSVSQWTKWIGLSNLLAPNSVYAYSIRARDVNGNGSGYMQVMNSDPNPYAGGQLGLFPSATGGANFGNGADDATFMIHLGTPPPTQPVVQSVNIAPANSPANPVYLGSPVTLSVTAIGTAPLSYQWYSDNGSGGATFNPILNATNNPYVLATGSLSPTTQYEYEVVVANLQGMSTSSIVSLNLTNATGPLLVSGTVITPPVVVQGSSVTMTASFTGSSPISYQWEHAGTNVLGATNTSLTFTPQFSDGGIYTLVASNNPPGLGSQIANSGSATLYVVAAGQTNTVNVSIADGGSSPTTGSYDVDQLVDGSVTPPENGFNYYVDNGVPPGQIFTTGATPPVGFGGAFPLNYVYVKEDNSVGNAGLSTAQTYTLRVYKMLSASSAQLLTTYVTTNTLSGVAGDWILLNGLTNVLQPSTAYAFSISRNTTGYWRLACNIQASPFPDGQAALLPIPGGAATLSSPDANGLYYDAAYVAGLTPPAIPVVLNDTVITPSTVYNNQSSVTMTATFTGKSPIYYQWYFNNGSGAVPILGATNTSYTIPQATYANAGSYNLVASNSLSAPATVSSTPTALTVNAPPTTFVMDFSWPAYSGPGVIGTGTSWNQVNNNAGNPVVNGLTVTAWQSTVGTSTLDDGSTPMPIQFNIDSPSSFGPHGSGIVLLDDWLLMQGQPSTSLFPMTFNNCIPGVYNLVLYGVDGGYVGSKTAFTVNGVSQTNISTTDTAFVQSNNYVEFYNIPVTNTLSAFWSQISGNEAAFNGAQLQMAYSYANPQMFIAVNPVSQTNLVGAAVTLTALAEAPGQVFYQWRSNGIAVLAATNAFYAVYNATAGTASYDVIATNVTGLTGNTTAATVAFVNPSDLVWTGVGDGTTWDYSTLNWSNVVTMVNGAPFLTGAAVLFNDGTTDNTVALSGTLTPSAVTVNNNTQNYVFGGTGSISGGARLTKSGSGSLTIDNYNNYTLGTVVNGGTLVLGAGGAAGAVSGPVTINTAAAVSLTTGDALGYGTGASATPVNIVGGSLDNATAGNEGFITSFNLTGGTLSSSGGGSFNMDGGSGVVVSSLASPNISTISAPISLRSDGVVFAVALGTVPGGVDLYISGPIQDAGGRVISKTGAGELQLDGTNTANGNITISAGTLKIAGNGSLNSGAFTATVINNGTFNYASSVAQALGPVSGTGNVIQEGSGTLTISGITSYTGNTTVDGGKLDIALGPLATNSTVTVASGAVLQLDFATTNIVTGLVLDGVGKGPGVYNNANSSPYIIGTGSLQIPGAVGPSGSAPLAHSLSGNTLSFSWPAGQGWRLQAMTNSLSVGIRATNWVYVTDGSVSSANITIDRTKPTVFYRLTYP